jgi:hypothetical protein
MGFQEMKCDELEMRGNELLEWAREENEPELERYATDALCAVDRIREGKTTVAKARIFGKFRVIENALEEEREIGPWEQRVYFTD